MARYEHLPIYKAAYDLFIEALQTTKTFPRDYRYTLGEHFHKTAVELLKSVYRTNISKNKTDSIKEILYFTQEMGILIRAAHDLKILADNKFLSLIEKRDSIEKQATGWLKSLGNDAGVPSSEGEGSVHSLSRQQRLAFY